MMAYNEFTKVGHLMGMYMCKKHQLGLLLQEYDQEGLN